MARLEEAEIPIESSLSKLSIHEILSDIGIFKDVKEYPVIKENRCSLDAALHFWNRFSPEGQCNHPATWKGLTKYLEKKGFYELSSQLNEYMCGKYNY